MDKKRDLDMSFHLWRDRPSKLSKKPNYKYSTSNNDTKPSYNIQIKHFPSPHLNLAFYTKALKYMY